MKLLLDVTCVIVLCCLLRSDTEMTSGIIHPEKQAISSEKQAQAACDESEQLHVVLFSARSQRDNAQLQTAPLTAQVLPRLGDA